MIESSHSINHHSILNYGNAVETSFPSLKDEKFKLHITSEVLHQ